MKSSFLKKFKIFSYSEIQMNFREKGKLAKVKFSNINNINKFDRYIDRLFVDAYTHQAIEFISSMLNRSSNQTLFLCAIKIAAKFDNPPDIWGLIITEFNGLIKGKNKPTWTNNFVHTMMTYDKFSLYNYQMESLVYLMLKYDEQYSAYWLETISKKPWFSKNEYSIKTAFLKYVDKLDPIQIYPLFKYFKDYYFYKELIKGSKNPKMIGEVLKHLSTFKMDVTMFFGGETLDELMVEFKDKLKNDPFVFAHLNKLAAEFYTEKTGKLFVELMDESIKNTELKKDLLLKIQHIKSPEVNGKLFELTGDEEYLPQEAKEIFLF